MEGINHVAIILDGNRRWAKVRGLRPELGHKEGARVLEEFAQECDKLGLKYLTVYCFSTENWNRAKHEVNYLMAIFEIYFKRLIENMSNYNIKINFLGSDDKISKKLKKLKYEAMEKTKDKTGMQLNLCFNYGGRRELTETIKKISEEVKEGKISIEDITEEYISNSIYSKNIPDPDLLIRTSGEQRISNFLLWQIAYTEMLFVEKNWPDFRIEDLKEAIENFKSRNRRFGGK